MREQHPWWGLVFERTCSRIRCRSSTDHRQFRQSRDATAPGTIRHFVFVLRKTLNQRSLCFHAPTQSLGGCIAWYGWANNLGLPLRLVSPTAGSPEVLVGMLDEDRRENAKGGLAGDHRPICGRCRSPRGRAPRRGVVRCDSARQLRDRKSTRLNSSHGYISYAVFCLKKKIEGNDQEVDQQKQRELARTGA